MWLVLANDFPPEHGGIQRFMHRIAEGLCDRSQIGGVTVIAPASSRAESFDRTQRYAIVRAGGRSNVSRFALGLLASLRSTARQPTRGTIASIWFPTGLIAALLPRRLRGTLVVLAHGTEIAPSKGGLRRSLMRFTFRRADAVVANSSFTAGLLRQSGIVERVVVVACGVDPLPLPPDGGSAAPLLLSVGRLVARKGIDNTIRAIALLKDSHPSLRYDIVGSGPDRARLEALALECGVDDRVRFAGAVDDAALTDFYARASCFALPARRIADDVEGFGIVYLEAAMMGLPTIGGRDSGAVDAIAHGETGLLVDGESTAQIAEAIARLVDDRELSLEMGRRGRDRALAAFTWRRCVERIAGLVETRLTDAKRGR